MPIDGVPLVLENLLVSLLSSQDIKSWNIFSEHSGSVSVRIRFSPTCIQNTCTDTHVSNFKASSVCSYKRKSPSQLKRDNERSLRRRKNSNFQDNTLAKDKLYSELVDQATCTSEDLIDCKTICTSTTDLHVNQVFENKRSEIDSDEHKHCLLYTSPSPRD